MTDEEAKAAAHAEGRLAARELISEYEAESGPLPESFRVQARQFMADAGLLDGGLRQPSG